MGTIIAFLTLVATINHSEIFNVSSRLEALWFAVQLFLIAVLSILGFQLLGFILENIGEISNRIDFNRIPEDDYWVRSSNRKRVGIWVINNTDYDLVDCWAKIEAIRGRLISGGDKVLRWKGLSKSDSQIVKIMPHRKRFLNIAEEDKSFVSFLSVEEFKLHASPAPKQTYWGLSDDIVILISGKIDGSPKTTYFYGKIDYQSVPPGIPIKRVGGAIVYPRWSSTIHLKEITKWKTK